MNVAIADGNAKRPGRPRPLNPSFKGCLEVSRLPSALQIGAMNKAHEEAHRSGYETAFAKCKARFEKELIGKDDSDLD